jgi:hypothetical protein
MTVELTVLLGHDRRVLRHQSVKLSNFFKDKGDCSVGRATSGIMLRTVTFSFFAVFVLKTPSVTFVCRFHFIASIEMRYYFSLLVMSAASVHSRIT